MYRVLDLTTGKNHYNADLGMAINTVVTGPFRVWSIVDKEKELSAGDITVLLADKIADFVLAGEKVKKWKK